MKTTAARLTLWYLTIPLLLWFIGWVEPAVSIPLAALLAWVVSRQNIPSHSGPNLFSLAIAALVAAALVFSLGIDGHLLQTFDFTARNAIYSDLIHKAWPVQYPDGRYLLYPSHFWLIPALIATRFPVMENLCLELWCGLGFLLLFLNLQESLGTRRTLVALVAMLFICSLTCAVDNILNTVFHKDAIFGVTFGMPSNLSQFFNTFHYFLIAGLGLSLLVKPQLSWRTFSLIGAVLAALHPMGAAAILPWFVWRAWHEWQTFSKADGRLSLRSLSRVLMTPEIAIGGSMVLVSLVYYISGDGSSSQLAFYAPYGPGLTSRGVFLYLSGVALNALPLLLAYKASKFKPLLILACTLPFIQLCRFGCDNGINEWAYKTVCVQSFLLAYAVAANIHKRSMQMLLILLFAVSVIPIARQMVNDKKIMEAVKTGFRYKPENVRDGNKGSMYYAEKSNYLQLTAPSLKCPVLFRKTSDAKGDK